MKFGIIGGSGLYDIEGIQNLIKKTIETPFGSPSDELIEGQLSGKDVVFLPRHGKGHRILPSEINFKANIWALKSLGVTHLISVSAVGSLKKEIHPGHIVFPDQFIDRTKDRPSTFFGNGIVAHCQFGNPVSQSMIEQLANSASKLGIDYHKNGTYICMEGPIFSTKAESHMYRSFGASVIGMTNIQEAKLAREAEMCFATIALSTDYDCWHESEEEVSVEAVLAVMAKNIDASKRILKDFLTNYDQAQPEPEHSSLQYAILTDKALIPAKTKEDLSVIIGKYCN